MKLTTPREIIEELGGIKAVAEITGREYRAVENWNRQKTFPANTFLVLQGALYLHGHTAPHSLWRM